QDSVQQWVQAHRWRATSLSRASWDYRSRSLRLAGADATPLGDIGAEDVDTAGPYGWQDSMRGQRRAQQQFDAQQVAAQTIQGQGTWRQLAPGTRFGLSQQRSWRPMRSSCACRCGTRRATIWARRCSTRWSRRWARWRWPARRCRQRW
ncbi:hypothetical protein LMG9585_21400, partial [Xanthomonas oryzae pv. oryzae]